MGKRRWACLVGFVLSVAGLIFSIALIQVEKDYRPPLSPAPFGNRTVFAQGLREKGLPFSFLVISDTHNNQDACTLLKEMVRGSEASFLIHVGDVVTAPNIWSHRYFIKRMTEDIKPPFPVFLAPGNHDIYYGFQKVPEGQGVSPEIYRRLYGATGFDFTYNNCLFVLCGVDLGQPDGFVDDLRRILSEKAAGKRHIFVFLHYPPSSVIPGFDFPREKEFLSLLEEYKVKACFFGHYHGYRRVESRGTDMIVLGGGGGNLKYWQSEWGKFHHGLKITVGENSVTEDILALEHGALFEHSFRWKIAVYVLPFIQGRVWVVYAFGFFCLGCLVVLIRQAVKP
jgi:Icc-related predicted phosphoesterase